MDIPEIEPTEIIAGTTVKWNRSDLSTDFPADGGWTLTYTIRGTNSYTVTATASGKYFTVSILATETEKYTPGTYKWIARVSKSPETYEIGSGTLTVKPDLATITGQYEVRSFAKQFVDAAETFLLSQVGAGFPTELSVAGRILRFQDQKTFDDRYAYFSNQVVKEQNSEKLARGEGTSSKIKVSFVSP